MSDAITSVHGHKVYRHHDFPCICVDFDYWGKPATLQVPYARYRPLESAKYCDKCGSIFGTPKIHQDSKCITGKYVTSSMLIPQVSDHELQERLKEFRNDGTGSRNTDVLMNHDSPAAKLCRNLGVPGVPKGYFDLGNVYEMAIIWLESDIIDMVDPTTDYYPEKRLGGSNPNGRFYNSGVSVHWSSSEYGSSSAWYVNYNGAVNCANKYNSLGIIPSRVFFSAGSDTPRFSSSALSSSDPDVIDAICSILSANGIVISNGIISILGRKLVPSRSPDILAVLDRDGNIEGYIKCSCDRPTGTVIYEVAESPNESVYKKEKHENILGQEVERKYIVTVKQIK